MSYLNRIRGVDGVVEATPFIWFGGIYQDERNQIAAHGDRARHVLRGLPRVQAAARAARRLDRGSREHDRRQGARGAVRLEGRRYGSHPLVFLPQGRRRRHLGHAARRYLRGDERRQLEPVFPLRLSERVAGPEWRARLDRLRDHEDRGSRRRAASLGSPSTRCSRTRRPRRRPRPSARSFRASRIRWATSATIVTAVASAVFFTMLLVTGNTMAQSVRERINEIAVLKTLGLLEARRRGARADRVVR